MDAILASVTSYLTASPFKVGPNAVQILDGKDEGVFAWVTVNFLLGNFQPGMETVGIMDLGGGSTQIVLAPEDDDEIDALPDQYVASVPLGETAMDVYQYSHLGYGLMEARKAHRTQAAAQVRRMPSRMHVFLTVRCATLVGLRARQPRGGRDGVVAGCRL